MNPLLSAKQQLIFNQQKRSMFWAYLIWFFLGGGGFNYLYVGGKYKVACLVLVSTAVLSLAFPPLGAVNVIAALVGLVHTYFAVNDRNADIVNEIIVMYPEPSQI